MADERRDPGLSRRSFLRNLPALLGRRIEETRKSIPGRIEGFRRRAAEPGGVESLLLPAAGRPLDGLPIDDPWLGAAWAVAAARGRRRSAAFLAALSGQAFAIVHPGPEFDAGPAGRGANPLPAALAAAGLVARAAPGGPFEPAIGGVGVALGKGFTVLLGLPDGPAAVRSVDPGARTAVLARPGEEPREISFDALAREWEGGGWPGGRAPFLRVVVETGPDRPAAEMAAAALPGLAAQLARDEVAGRPAGPAAWTALAEDAREGRLADPAGPAGRFLDRLAVARLAAGEFLREAGAGEAADRMREIHAPSVVGETWGAGLLAEAAAAVRGDPPWPERAAELFVEIREVERATAGLLSAAGKEPG